MAKQIIILDRQDNLRFRVAYWLVPPVARQPFYANAGASSTFKDATAGEVAAIQSGAVVERLFDKAFPFGTSLAGVKSALISEYNAYQTALNATNLYDFYGTFYDGAAWTTGGVA